MGRFGFYLTEFVGKRNKIEKWKGRVRVVYLLVCWWDWKHHVMVLNCSNDGR